MAMCVMAVVAVAPCQCFSPGGNQTMSPGRISLVAPPQRCARPQPAVIIRVWPSEWVCHAVRAPGSNMTLAPTARAGSFARNRGSMRTVPVKYSAGPFVEGCEPLRLMSIFGVLCLALNVIFIICCSVAWRTVSKCNVLTIIFDLGFCNYCRSLEIRSVGANIK
jgi:hypothetical protein